jgi:sigma-B regulation protein RsbU (phosphoserine phosphatase)
MALIVETMREMSGQTDPQAMVRVFGKRSRALLPIDRSVSLSRRSLEPPKYRITRSSTWKDEINPWKEKDRLPILDGGLLGELIYGDEPRIIDDLIVPADDPGAEFLAGQRSLMAIPTFDQGVAMNMVVLMREGPAAFSYEQFPEWVWFSNLFGRATHNLVLSEQLREAYNAVDQELKVVGDIQRSLLPTELPRIPTMDVAAYYQTSRRAGGDYYDFFPLPGGKWGIFLADVSGHGTPAAVLMAITHSIAHTHPGPPAPPAEILT